jgi:hypothetical protein
MYGSMDEASALWVCVGFIIIGNLLLVGNALTLNGMHTVAHTQGTHSPGDLLERQPATWSTSPA